MALLTPETFDFVLANELKRAVRSQNFVTLVLIHPRDGDRDAAVREIATLVTRELRETDLLAAGTGFVSLVLLDADLQSAMRVIERVMARLEHYQFTVPLHIDVGAACCPTHGVDVDTLRRVAAEARTGPTRHTSRGSAHAK
jgi:hypothetical protein